jgi:hypothetical protein
MNTCNFIGNTQVGAFDNQSNQNAGSENRPDSANSFPEAGVFDSYLRDKREASNTENSEKNYSYKHLNDLGFTDAQILKIPSNCQSNNKFFKTVERLKELKFTPEQIVKIANSWEAFDFYNPNFGTTAQKLDQLGFDRETQTLKIIGEIVRNCGKINQG